MAEEFFSLAKALREKAAADPDKVFLRFEDQQITYGQLNQRTNRVANGLTGLGIKPRDGIAIMMPNRPEFLDAFFATQKLGTYAVPVNIALKGEGLAYILNHSEAKALFISADLVEALLPIRGTLPAIKHLIVDTIEAPAGFAMPPGAITLAELAKAPADEPRVTLDAGAIAALLYTSGTTGLPKGVVFRYRGFGMFAAAGAGYQPGDVLYTCLPLFHANALFLSVIRGLVAGYVVALGRRFSASRFWDDIRRYRATTFNALGAMIPILLKQPPRPDDADNTVRIVFSAATPAWAWAEFEKRFNLTVWEGYGAVDGGGFSLFNAGTSPKGSMGKAPPGIQAKVVDDNGAECAVGEAGNLIFKIDDPNARRVEYFKNPDATDAKIRDGWLYTGDMAYCDAEGNYFFADRKTDSMRRRGENISSYEVEKIVNQHPAVLESGAFGVPSELGEDDVMVAVVLRPGHSVAPAELRRFCEERMAKFMVPRYLDFPESLPKTETHRVQKAVLKKQGVTATTWDYDKAAAPPPARAS